jgi:murein DD-endopeptidase MepM/ murein hydrolase activator NlpD
MTENLREQAKDAFDRLFEERQIYVRSSGSVRYISITPRQQAISAGSVLVALGWFVYASASTLTGGMLPGSESSSERRIAKLERFLQQERAKAASAMAMLDERTDSFTRATDDLERRHETLKGLLGGLAGPTSTGLDAVRGNDGALMMSASLEMGDARVSRSGSINVASEDGTIRGRINRLGAEQFALLDEVEAAAIDRAEGVRSVLRLTGVGEARLVSSSAFGGPLVSFDSALASTGDAVFDDRARTVMARLAEAKELEQVAAAVPLGEPVGTAFRETSGFGPRIDPISRGLAHHTGLDLVAYKRAPIISTAPGTVSFAGNKVGYGRVVEIDHGNGFKTRYAHLDSIAVKVGDPVAMGQKIGAMGNTGRSTGTHLHYEVWFRGTAYDPIKFLRAGRYVQQQG